ncbi:Crp/Fnr family transcriptional regulator [Devosia sp. Leaf64]|uniref:Crp/Fnr family transcriptional regulator n=1 Tax=Devosia sp. Leaf64 TaxID=1736229 RepID=UPI000714FBE3|nr:Crp/Fnr family transcriptional regulator [Devosia sp. Leaf64]KQN74768.1 hypothetical protein ASE94_00025 [Devosia sp. Leaf64]
MIQLNSTIRLFAHRLSGAGAIPEADIEAFQDIIGPPIRFDKHDPLVQQGDRSDVLWLTAIGWALRQRVLPDGRRQISAILLPGELTDKGIIMPFGATDSVVAATELWAHAIDRNSFIALVENRPRLERALFYEELTRHAVTREWLLLLGQRNAKERVAYFFYEIFARLSAMGMLHGNTFTLPLVQSEVADIVGMSTVHFNRTLQHFRSLDLVMTDGQKVTLPRPIALAELAMFDAEIIRIARDFQARAAMVSAKLQ